MTSSRLAWVCSIVSISSGCGSGGGGGGDEPPACVAVETQAMAWSQRSPLGFSADELLGTLGSEHESRLARASGSSSALDLELARDGAGSLAFQTREPADGVQPGSDSECGEALSVPVTLSFTTNDGAFAETWSIELLAESAARATGHAEIDLLDLGGTFMVTDVDPARYDAVLGLLDVELDATGWRGSLVGEARNGSRRARSFDIGTF